LTREQPGMLSSATVIIINQKASSVEGGQGRRDDPISSNLRKKATSSHLPHKIPAQPGRGRHGENCGEARLLGEDSGSGSLPQAEAGERPQTTTWRPAGLIEDDVDGRQSARRWQAPVQGGPPSTVDDHHAPRPADEEFGLIS